MRIIAEDEILGVQNLYTLPTIKYLANTIFQCPKSPPASKGYAIMCKDSFEKVRVFISHFNEIKWCKVIKIIAYY